MVTGRHRERARALLGSLQAAGIETSSFAIAGEPTVDEVRIGARAATGQDVVIGFGGGSAIDAAKAIAAVAANSGEPLDYLEVIGKGQALEKMPIPFLAIPTTAGTGAEVTRNAVLDSREHRVKASLRGASLLARAAVVDPELTLDLPPAITANSGLDALTQLIEAFVSCRANPLTDSFCKEGMTQAAWALRTCYYRGSDRKARESMAWASLLSGLALANAGLGAVHGFAGPLGGLLHAPHGALCAAMLPWVMETNIRALRARTPGHEALSRYQQVAALLTGGAQAAPEEGIDWVATLCRELNVVPLAVHGLERSQIPGLIRSAQRASSMKGNPIVLEEQELREFMERALG